jgi:two-component system, chemotaxis family, protein-glutamate methylesterase/glutaminase
MPRHIVVIGASAGGLQALTTLVERLPSSLPAAVLVVMHTRASSNGVLPDILRRAGILPVQFAKDGDVLAPGHIYVARPDYHLLVTETGLRVVHGPKENGFRPAIDPLFRTAARVCGPRVIGVILSGALSDGAYGLSVIKQHGGIAIVQDPDDAIIPSMPRSALQAVEVDHVLPAGAIAEILERLGEQMNEGASDMAGAKDLEPQLPSEQTEVASMEERYGAPSSLTCPDCGGALWELHDGQLVRYQCHVGHQYSQDGLETHQREAVEVALWSAVRVLEEHAALKMRMAQRAKRSGLHVVSEGFSEGAMEAHRQAQTIRSLLFGGNGPGNGAGVASGNAGAATAKTKAARAKVNATPPTTTATRRPSARHAARPKSRKR